MKDRLSTNLQEDLLILLCFHDEHSKLIRNSVSEDLFEGVYSEIVYRVYNYIDRYEESPKEAIATIFDDILEGDNEAKANMFSEVITNVYESRNSVNVKYTIDRITDFIRKQELKKGIMEAASELQKDNEGSIDRAEDILNQHLDKRMELFDPGTFLGDLSESLKFLDEEKLECFPTGIEEFDRLGIGPIRGQLILLMALYAKGKSFWLTNLGKRALLNRYKVCHITLELGRNRILERYYKTLFAIATSQDPSIQTDFEFDGLKDLIGLDTYKHKAELSLDDPNIRDVLLRKAGHLGAKLNNLVVKEFPTSSLSIKQLEAYLDNLESSKGFVPDLLIIDYADLMKIEGSDYRIGLGEVFKKLRGIAGKRNIAVSTVTQSNREGEGTKELSGRNIAEDFSKLGTVDIALAYNQTKEEEKRKLARIGVLRARDAEDGFSVLINQNYDTAQFAMESVRMKDDFWDLLEEHGKEE